MLRFFFFRFLKLNLSKSWLLFPLKLQTNSLISSNVNQVVIFWELLEIHSIQNWSLKIRICKVFLRCFSITPSTKASSASIVKIPRTLKVQPPTSNIICSMWLWHVMCQKFGIEQYNFWQINIVSFINNVDLSKIIFNCFIKNLNFVREKWWRSLWPVVGVCGVGWGMCFCFFRNFYGTPVNYDVPVLLFQKFIH